MTFWLNDPLILFRQEHLSFWPSKQQTFTEKLNSMTRLIVIVTLFGYLVTKSVPILIVSLVSLLSIVGLYFVKRKEAMTPNMKLDQVTGETQGDSTLHKVTDSSLDNAARKHWYPQKSSVTRPEQPEHPTHSKAVLRIDRADERPREANEQAPTKENPMMNVLMTDYKKRPHRPRAEPAFAPTVRDKINQKTKEQIEDHLEQKLFRDLGDEIDFDHSMRQFTTTANTKIPNDQMAFAQFCYGNMSSCKDGEVDKCFADETKLGQVYA